LEFLEEYQRNDVDEKIELLRRNWTDLKNFVFLRVDLIKVYIQFHQEAEIMTVMFGQLEAQLRGLKPHDRTQFVDDAWSRIQSQYGKLKSIAKQFGESSDKVRVRF
jgi:hypothetical protein